MKNIIIAIDGHSSCGKSTLARSLAEALNFTYISTGKMYRAVTLFFLENNIDYKQPVLVKAALDKIKIHFEDQGSTTFLNGKNVEAQLVESMVANNVSPVAALTPVREEMVRQQQEMGLAGGVVMDGRDIGTVVFPEAALKIFLTAEPDIRARRRYDELIGKGIETEFEAVKKNLTDRDLMDSTRENSPLKKAEDAVLIDNTNLSRKEQMAMVKVLALERMSA